MLRRTQTVLAREPAGSQTRTQNISPLTRTHARAHTHARLHTHNTRARAHTHTHTHTHMRVCAEAIVGYYALRRMVKSQVLKFHMQVLQSLSLISLSPPTLALLPLSQFHMQASRLQQSPADQSDGLHQRREESHFITQEESLFITRLI